MLKTKLPRFGYHPSLDRGYLSAIERPLALGCKAIQIWVGNSKAYASKELTEDVYNPVAKLVKENNIFLISHSPYIINFARPLQHSSAGRKALERYLRDLVNITNLGGVGSVLHMGSNIKELGQDMPTAYKTFVDNLRWIVERKPPNAIIILENMAGGGNQMCCWMNDWADFWNNYVDKDLKGHIRWCADTAHLYANGEYDLSLRTEAFRFYKEFDRYIGWDFLLCFHFNGSKTQFGKHKDNHADIGPEKSGWISTKGLRQIARIAGATDKPMILEVPVDDHTLIEQFELVSSWFVNSF